MTNLERDQLQPTAPEVSVEVTLTIACYWFFTLHTQIVPFCMLLINIMGSYTYCCINNSSLIPMNEATIQFNK